MFAQKRRKRYFASLLLADPVRRFSPCGLSTFLKGAIFTLFKGYWIKERSQFGNSLVQAIGFLHSTQPRNYCRANETPGRMFLLARP